MSTFLVVTIYKYYSFQYFGPSDNYEKRQTNKKRTL